jgi:hypothetical protein
VSHSLDVTSFGFSATFDRMQWQFTSLNLEIKETDNSDMLRSHLFEWFFLKVFLNVFLTVFLGCINTVYVVYSLTRDYKDEFQAYGTPLEASSAYLVAWLCQP